MATEVSLEALRAETAWLRRVAGALTRDDALAEDAVQETCLARLLHPPAEGSPGWLRVVLRNAVRKRARGEGRRRGRERQAQAIASTTVPDAEELALRLEAQRLVGELVLALDEPYRSTVLLRYHEGLEPAEIARRQGVPAGTVRWRLKTGLDRLRAGLDRKYQARRWGALLLPLPGERAPWGSLIVAKAATKVAALAVAVLLALLVGRRMIESGVNPGGPSPVTGAHVDGGAGSSGQHGERRLGTYRPGARTPVPRFVTAAASPEAAGPPRFVSPPRRLDHSGNGPRSRFEHPPPNFEAVRAQIRGRLDDFEARADRCLSGWTAPDPALEKGVMLRIELDPAGLQAVSIDDLVDVPAGPLRCLGDAVYAIDWGRIVDRPIMLTVPQRYAPAGDGAR